MANMTITSVHHRGLVRSAPPAPAAVTNALARESDDDACGANQWGDDPPTVGVGAFSGASSSTSAVAALTRELKALEVRYFRTREQLDKVGERSDQLRVEASKLRAQSAKMERENAKLRQLLDRVHGEKKQVEAQAVSNRDYAKKIETKFFQGTPKAQLQTLVQSHVEMTAKIKSLEAQVAQKTEAAQTQQRELGEATDKIAILKRALETRFEQLQLNGSVHSGVLFELAKLQDQAASMALQLGQERKLSKALEVQLDSARARHVQLEEHVVVREAWLASVEKERAELAEKLAASDSDRQTAAFEKATLLQFIQQQAEAKFQLDAELKRVQDSKIMEAEASQARVQRAMDEAAALQQSVGELQGRLEASQAEAQRLEAAWRGEQQTTDELRTRQHALFLDIQRLQDEYKRKDEELLRETQRSGQLQAAMDRQQQQEQALLVRVDELEAIVAALGQEIEQRKSEEAALRTAMETALRDLETLSRQRNEAARAMNEAVTISASSLDEQQALEAKVETQRKQLEQLKHAKNLLQNAMLEQLSALRRQLQLERLQRIELEAKYKQQLGGGGGDLPPLTPAPSMDSTGVDEELLPLPPPPARASPVPPHHVSLGQQKTLDRQVEDRPQVLELAVNERTTMVVPSPSDSLSLLDLAGAE